MKSSSPIQNPTEQIPAPLARDLRSGDGGLALLTAICRDIGPRPAGSTAFRAGLDLLAAEWARNGVADIHTEAVPVVAWRDDEAGLTLLANPTEPIPCLQAFHSASTSIEAPLRDVGALADDPDGPAAGSLSGQIALMRGPSNSGGRFILRHKFLMRLQEAGASGIIIAGYHAQLPSREFTHPAHKLNIPVVFIAESERARIAERLVDHDLRARIETRGETYPAACANLVGEIKPDRPTDGLILLTAHFDSHPVSPGAFDNLTGVATLSEIARVLAPHRASFRRALRIVAFTGEEYWFVGSKQYVRDHADELDRIKLVLNLDSLFDHTARGVAIPNSPAMRDVIAGHLALDHPDVDARNHFCMSSDYLPFMLKGVPVARPAAWAGTFPPWSHTIEDNADKIPLEWLKLNADVFGLLLYRLLADPNPLPDERDSASAVKTRIQTEGVEEEIVRWFDYGPDYADRTSHDRNG